MTYLTGCYGDKHKHTVNIPVEYEVSGEITWTCMLPTVLIELKDYRPDRAHMSIMSVELLGEKWTIGVSVHLFMYCTDPRARAWATGCNQM